MAVVMLTAYGATGRAVEAMKLGAVDFLEKPFDPKVIHIQRKHCATKYFGVALTYRRIRILQFAKTIVTPSC
jgi:DNA-binding NtrC family response regulator